MIENTAGQGSNLGFAFEHLAYLIERVEDEIARGGLHRHLPCLCRRIRPADGGGLRQTFAELERVVGFEYLKGMHLNDAMKSWAAMSTATRRWARG